jgi:hypothetical protein
MREHKIARSIGSLIETRNAVDREEIRERASFPLSSSARIRYRSMIPSDMPALEARYSAWEICIRLREVIVHRCDPRGARARGFHRFHAIVAEQRNKRAIIDAFLIPRPYASC